MTTNNTTEGAPATPPVPTDPAAAQTAYTPPATQAELDRIIGERVARAVKPFEGYDAMKAELDTMKAATQTDLERAEAARKAAETAASTTASELRVLRAATKHGVPAEYVDLITGADDAAVEAAAVRVAALAAGATPPADGTPGVRFADPAQGQPPAPDEAAVKEAFARQLFGV